MTDTNGSTLTLTLEEVRDKILHLVTQGNIGHYQIGWHYNYVVENKLAEKSGYESAWHYFSQHVKALSQSALSLYGRVAREFSEEECARYGAYHLNALLSYEKAASIQLPDGEPGSASIEVPREDGTVEQKSFAECTVEELQEAARHKKEEKKKEEPPASEVDVARVQFLRDSLARHFSKPGRLRLNTRLHRGKMLLTLQDIPVEELERVIEALMDGLQPVHPVRNAG